MIEHLKPHELPRQLHPNEVVISEEAKALPFPVEQHPKKFTLTTGQPEGFFVIDNPNGHTDIIDHDLRLIQQDPYTPATIGLYKGQHDADIPIHPTDTTDTGKYDRRYVSRKQFVVHEGTVELHNGNAKINPDYSFTVTDYNQQATGVNLLQGETTCIDISTQGTTVKIGNYEMNIQFADQGKTALNVNGQSIPFSDDSGSRRITYVAPGAKAPFIVLYAHPSGRLFIKNSDLSQEIGDVMTISQEEKKTKPSEIDTFSLNIASKGHLPGDAFFKGDNFFIVCDGVTGSGTNKGLEAANETLGIIYHNLLSLENGPLQSEHIVREQLKKALLEVENHFMNSAELPKQYATTLSLAIRCIGQSGEEGIVSFSIGDSPIYKISPSDSTLRRASVDDTFGYSIFTAEVENTLSYEMQLAIQELIDRHKNDPKILQYELEQFVNDNDIQKVKVHVPMLLNHNLGLAYSIDPTSAQKGTIGKLASRKMHFSPVQPGETVVVASDGFYDYDSAQICDIVSRTSDVPETFRKMATEISKGHYHDDLTVVGFTQK